MFFSESTLFCMSLLFIALTYLIDFFTVPVPANTETSHRICSIVSYWRNIFSLVYPVQVSFFFLALPVFFFLPQSLSLPLSVPVCVSFSLSAFIDLSSRLSLSLRRLLNCFCLPLVHFFYSLSLLTLLTLASSVFVCSTKWGFRIQKIETAKGMTHQL